MFKHLIWILRENALYKYKTFLVNNTCIQSYSYQLHRACGGEVECDVCNRDDKIQKRKIIGNVIGLSHEKQVIICHQQNKNPFCASLEDPYTSTNCHLDKHLCNTTGKRGKLLLQNIPKMC